MMVREDDLRLRKQEYEQYADQVNHYGWMADEAHVRRPQLPGATALRAVRAAIGWSVAFGYGGAIPRDRKVAS